MTYAHFEQFRKNLAVRNEDAISTSYRSITTRLNKDYWDLESDSTHCLQVGSYGRNTAIHGISDLDMVFELPAKDLDRFKRLQGNGPSQMLQEVKKYLQARYPKTEIRGDGQVVVVDFSSYRVEIVPAFYNADDNSYTYGDTNNGGSWCKCKPRQEIAAFNERNRTSNRNLKRVCKILRSWKEAVGAPMSGILIDTLAYKFFSQTTDYDDKSYGSYSSLVHDVFTYLANLPDQAYWLVPGSSQRVFTSGSFQQKAKKAAIKCQEAIDEDTNRKKESLWKDVFGSRFFPSLSVMESAAARGVVRQTPRTEEFIEDKFPIDIRYNLEIDCDITANGKDEGRLRWLQSHFPWLSLGRTLRFYVSFINVPRPYGVLWKVRNVGDQAVQRNMIRGQIVSDMGREERIERTNFPGPHFVECFIIKDGNCVARDRLDVPISQH